MVRFEQYEAAQAGQQLARRARQMAGREYAREVGTLAESEEDVDRALLFVDGACNLIKGGKGALSREKLVQAEAARYVVVVDEPKLCARVGGAHPVPVEILPVFAQRTLRQIAALPALAPCDARLRYGDAPAGLDGVTPFPPKPFVTDNGNYIVDCFRQAPLDDVAAAAAALKATSGVVEHGLFVGAPSTVVVVGKADGGVDTFAGK